MSGEMWQTIIQVFGTPGLILAGLYWMWHGKVEAEIGRVMDRIETDVGRMTSAVEGIRRDLNSHREVVLAEQQAHRERLQRLEIIAEQAQAEKEGRARRLHRGGL
jgi:hypothetical protein